MANANQTLLNKFAKLFHSLEEKNPADVVKAFGLGKTLFRVFDPKSEIPNTPEEMYATMQAFFNDLDKLFAVTDESLIQNIIKADNNTLALLSTDMIADIVESPAYKNLGATERDKFNHRLYTEFSIMGQIENVSPVDIVLNKEDLYRIIENTQADDVGVGYHKGKVDAKVQEFHEIYLKNADLKQLNKVSKEFNKKPSMSRNEYLKCLRAQNVAIYGKEHGNDLSDANEHFVELQQDDTSKNVYAEAMVTNQNKTLMAIAKETNMSGKECAQNMIALPNEKRFAPKTLIGKATASFGEWKKEHPILGMVADTGITFGLSTVTSTAMTAVTTALTAVNPVLGLSAGLAIGGAVVVGGVASSVHSAKKQAELEGRKLTKGEIAKLALDGAAKTMPYVLGATGSIAGAFASKIPALAKVAEALPKVTKGIGAVTMFLRTSVNDLSQKVQQKIEEKTGIKRKLTFGEKVKAVASGNVKLGIKDFGYAVVHGGLKAGAVTFGAKVGQNLGQKIGDNIVDHFNHDNTNDADVKPQGEEEQDQNQDQNKDQNQNQGQQQNDGNQHRVLHVGKTAEGGMYRIVEGHPGDGYFDKNGWHFGGMDANNHPIWEHCSEGIVNYNQANYDAQVATHFGQPSMEMNETALGGHSFDASTAGSTQGTKTDLMKNAFSGHTFETQNLDQQEIPNTIKNLGVIHDKSGNTSYVFEVNGKQVFLNNLKDVQMANQLINGGLEGQQYQDAMDIMNQYANQNQMASSLAGQVNKTNTIADVIKNNYGKVTEESFAKSNISTSKALYEHTYNSSQDVQVASTNELNNNFDNNIASETSANENSDFENLMSRDFNHMANTTDTATNNNQNVAPKPAVENTAPKHDFRAESKALLAVSLKLGRNFEFQGDGNGVYTDKYSGDTFKFDDDGKLFYTHKDQTYELRNPLQVQKSVPSVSMTPKTTDMGDERGM